MFCVSFRGKEQFIRVRHGECSAAPRFDFSTIDNVIHACSAMSR